MRVFAAGGLMLVACGGPVDPTDPIDTDDGVPLGSCSVAEPRGLCNGTRICVGGACVVDVDPGAPAPPLAELEADWDRIGSEVERRYGAFEAKPDLDWSAVRTEVASALGEANTELEAIDVMARGLTRIGDGHTFLRHPACDGLPIPAFGWTNSGVCFAQDSEGMYRVSRLFAGAPEGVALGDALVSVDGRGVERLLDDMGAQPGCPNVGSTPAMDHRRRVHTLGWREVGERLSLMTIAGEDLEVSVRDDRRFARCDGRPAMDLTPAPGEVSWTRLADGEILYVTFPFFGAYDASGRFVEEPMRSTLRQVFADNTDASGIVLDLRGNGGGYASIYFDLAGWLYAEPTVLFYNGAPLRTGGEAFAFRASPDPELSFAEVPVAVLTDETSFSAADFTAGFLIQTGRARAFGQPTGGGFGSGDGGVVGAYTLGINTFYALDRDLQPWEGRPPPVDEPVTPSADDLAAGDDAVLREALAWLGEGGG